MFQLEVVGNGNVRLIGRLDAAEADEAARAFDALEGSMVADCSQLEYISSAGISVLIVTYKRLHGSGHTFRLSALTPRVRNVFTYSGLGSLLGVE